MGGTSKQFIFLVVLGLCCCSKAFGERGLSFAAVHRLLTAMAAPATECRLQAEGLSRCGAQAVGAEVSVVAACGFSSCGTRA